MGTLRCVRLASDIMTAIFSFSSRLVLPQAKPRLRRLLPAAAAPAQGSAPGTTPQTVIHANANLVLLDVVVTDRGSAVHGIDRSRFHIVEDGKEQTISSFEEHQPASIPAEGYKPVVLPPHTYSNAPLYPPATAVNVLLLDGLNTPVDKQTDMRKQMIEYMGKIAPGTSLAVFTLTSRLRMIQGFTTDASQLAKAFESAKTTPHTSDVAVPAFRWPPRPATTRQELTPAATGRASEHNGSPTSRRSRTTSAVKITLDAFRQLALYLSSISGRKNIIWFSGSFPIGLDPDSSARNGFDAERMYADEVRETSEAMTAARVSVYPWMPRADESQHRGCILRKTWRLLE